MLNKCKMWILIIHIKNIFKIAKIMFNFIVIEELKVLCNSLTNYKIIISSSNSNNNNHILIKISKYL